MDNDIPGACRDQARPSMCCVPAFFVAAMQCLGDGANLAIREVALDSGLVMPPDAPNPWSLPVSDDPAAWGVPASDAPRCFRNVQIHQWGSVLLSLTITPLNTIAFELYEDEVMKHARSGSVVGISFDYRELCRRLHRSLPASGAMTRHVVRLTRKPADPLCSPTVTSDSFGFDYAGDICIFDDSGEIRDADRKVPWRDLLGASRAIDGALWVVSRP